MDTAVDTLKQLRSRRLRLLLSGYTLNISSNKSANRSLVDTIPDDIIQLLLQFMKCIKISLPKVYQQISFSIQDIRKTQGVPSLDSQLIGYFKSFCPAYMSFKLQAYLTDTHKIGLKVTI